MDEIFEQTFQKFVYADFKEFPSLWELKSRRCSGFERGGASSLALCVAEAQPQSPADTTIRTSVHRTDWHDDEINRSQQSTSESHHRKDRI
jgi:hypothetical protein